LRIGLGTKNDRFCVLDERSKTGIIWMRGKRKKAANELDDRRKASY
jgi:hypothetical protein